MIERPDIAIDVVPVTDGTIAVIDLESTRLQSWSRFWRAPEQPAIAEILVELELLTAQVCGDLGALDRLDTLVSQSSSFAGIPTRHRPHSSRLKSHVQHIDLQRRE